MERSLQSALEKRTRVGSWQTRVYRLERGYLSAWSDVVSAAAHEEPTRTDCLFHGDQVAKLTNQGEACAEAEFVRFACHVIIARSTADGTLDVFRGVYLDVLARKRGTHDVDLKTICRSQRWDAAVRCEFQETRNPAT